MSEEKKVRENSSEINSLSHTMAQIRGEKKMNIMEQKHEQRLLVDIMG